MAQPDSLSATSSSPDGEEEALVARLRRRDESAYEEIVRTRGGPLLAVARRLLGNEADAQDALQEAFLSAFRKLDQFSGKARFSTWLHRIVVNAALMRRRKLKRQREVPMDALLPSYMKNGHHVDPPAPWPDSAEAMAERAEVQQLVRSSIDGLPENHRTVLVLRDLEGLSTEETAGILGIQRGTVKTRLHRARQALRALLDPHVRGLAT